MTQINLLVRGFEKTSTLSDRRFSYLLNDYVISKLSSIISYLIVDKMRCWDVIIPLLFIMG